MGLGKSFLVRDGKAPEGKTLSDTPAAVQEVKASPKEVDIIDALLHNKEIVSEIETPYGVFEFKYPSGADSLRIAHRRAAYLGGFPDQSFDNSRRSQFEMWATLDILVLKKPDRFKDMESWADCPDQELAETLFKRGARFCGGIRREISEARPGQLDLPGEAGDS